MDLWSRSAHVHRVHRVHRTKLRWNHCKSDIMMLQPGKTCAFNVCDAFKLQNVTSVWPTHQRYTFGTCCSHRNLKQYCTIAASCFVLPLYYLSQLLLKAGGGSCRGGELKHYSNQAITESKVPCSISLTTCSLMEVPHMRHRSLSHACICMCQHAELCPASASMTRTDT